MEGLSRPYKDYIETMPNLGDYQIPPEGDEKMMERQVEELAPALVDIAKMAIEERPDMIVFTDKSARIFATPFARFLGADLQSDKNPKDRYNPLITFYNDDVVKDNIIIADDNHNMMVDIEPEFKDRIEKAMSFLRGKKIFVIDEAFAVGRSLRSVMEEIKLANEGSDDKIDVHFFSLTQDDEPTAKGKNPLPKNWREFRDETLAMAEHADNFKYTPYDIHTHEIFSKSGAFQYVINKGARTAPINKVLVSFEALANDPEFDDLSESIREEFLAKEQGSRNEIPKIFARATEAKKKLYQAMKSVQD